MSLEAPRPIRDLIAEEKAMINPAHEAASQLPYHVAFVIDNVVAQVFHVEERLAAILLSNPTIVQCASPANGGPDNNWHYDSQTGAFFIPE